MLFDLKLNFLSNLKQSRRKLYSNKNSLTLNKKTNTVDTYILLIKDLQSEYAIPV
ncbi:10787_t:CDS:2 [Cetraspora pellucida]|uniref:10787_t:CDS:1 n=1 Tax=Cetraspora pellucida TaxID=1433469 RepID=A0ACA9LCS9_9GLOM|nr:10787_t:CDS:2 [Cetraspora pellucida]